MSVVSAVIVAAFAAYIFFIDNIDALNCSPTVAPVLVPVPENQCVIPAVAEIIKEDLHIMYGEMVTAAYDVIEKSPHSINKMENFLGCDDEMETFMECLFPDYNFEGNLRAFVGFHKEGFYGFKAFNEKTGDLAIIIRGTIFLEDWALDIKFFRKQWPASNGSKLPIFLHRGFLYVYQKKDSCNLKSLGESLEEDIAKFAREGKMNIKTISLAGHSLGAAVATIATLGVAEQIHSGSLGQFKPEVRLISFASPRVGGKNLWQRLKDLNVTYDHYFNAGDVVPKLPPPIYPIYVHHPDKNTQHKMKPSKKDLRPAITKMNIFYGFERAHDMGHILYNIARDRVPSRINVSILNKHNDYLKHSTVPKHWFGMETRRLSADGKNEVVEIDISSNNCSSYNYDNDQWATEFINKYAFLHKKTCESASVRKMLNKDNYD